MGKKLASWEIIFFLISSKSPEIAYLIWETPEEKFQSTKNTFAMQHLPSLLVSKLEPTV